MCRVDLTFGNKSLLLISGVDPDTNAGIIGFVHYPHLQEEGTEIATDPEVFDKVMVGMQFLHPKNIDGFIERLQKLKNKMIEKKASGD